MKRSVSISILFLFTLLIGAGKPALTLGQGTVPDYQFQAIWGLPLEQDGLLRPIDITQGDNGDIYLVDEGRNQIMVFSADGEFRRAIGEAGNGPGQLYHPRYVSVHDGEVYVADSRNARIQVFSENGEFLRTIGEFKRPDKNDGLQLPRQVRVNADGQVFVLNRGYRGSYIFEYTKEGQFIQKKGVQGGDGLWALGPNGTLYVVTYKNRLLVMPLSGERQEYDLGEGAGQFVSVAAIYVNENTLWVYYEHDFSNPRVLEYSLDGVLRRTIVLQKETISANTLAKPNVTTMMVTEEGVRLVKDNVRVYLFDLEGRLLGTWGRRGAGMPGMFDHPDRLAAAPDGSLYVLERARRRIQHLDAQGQVISIIDDSALGGLHMWEPQDIAVDGWGRLYVLEGARMPSVLRFQNDVLEKRLTDLYPRYWPIGHGNETASRVDILGDSMQIYSRSPVLSQFDLEGTHITDTRFWGKKEGGDISQSTDGKTYLLSSSAVVKADLVRHQTEVWGKLGLKDGQFFRPSSILADNMGHIFVLDTDNGDYYYKYIEEVPYSSRIQALDPDGNFLASWGGFGSDEGHFINPQAIEMLADGRLVVADTDNNRLQVFSPVPPLSSPPPFPKPQHFDPPVDPVSAEWSLYAPFQGVDYPIQLEIRNNTDNVPIIYAKARNTGRLFTSNDGGETWQEPADYPRPIRNFILAGQHTIIVEVEEPDSFYRSDDDGLTWTPIFTQFWGWSNWIIDILPSPNFDEDRTLYLSGYGLGVYRSTDAGESWQSLGLEQHEVFLSDVSIDEEGNHYLMLRDYSLRKNFLLSVDGSVTWKTIGNEFDKAKFSTTFAADHTLFGLKNGKLYRSQDKGETWTEMELTGIPANLYFADVLIAPDFQDTQTLILFRNNESYITSDGGEHWRLIPPREGFVYRWLMTFSPDYRERPTIFRVDYSYLRTLIGRSDDGGVNWSPVGNGIPGAPTGALASLDDSADGLKWAAPSFRIFAGKKNTPWHPLETFPYGAIGYFRRSELALSPTFSQDSIVMAGKAISRDGGESWEVLSDVFNDITPHTIAFAPDFSHSHTMLAAGESTDWGWHPSRLWISEDGGFNWRRLSLSNSGIIFAIAFDANWAQNRTMYLAMENGVLRSTDGGASWERPSDALLGTNVVGLVSRQERNGPRLYAATSTAGVFVSDDQGNTWREFNQRLPRGQVCVFAGNDDFLVAGLCNGDIFVRPAYDVWRSIGTGPGVRPNDILILQNDDLVTLIASTDNDVFTTTFSTPISPILDRNLWLPYVH